MKELSVEQKAKRYDEALTKARNIVNSINVGLIGKDSFEAVFPELKESEDEKIRKAIKYGLDHVFTNNTTVFEVTKEQCLAWLEKQGEQNPADKVEPKFKVGDLIKLSKEPKYPAREIIAIQNDAYYFDETVYLPFSRQDEWELVEQKPAENEELTEFDKAVSVSIGTWNPKNPEQIQSVKAVSKKLLKLAKKQINDEQKSAEWNEEDEDNFNSAIYYIRREPYMEKTIEPIVDWLKSLKDRVQPHLKPSDEQMVVLNDIIINGHLSNANERILKGLQEQLKKLREE